MIDRYTRILLTVIASALVYLCIVLTPWPTLSAQQAQGTKYPGQPTGPVEVVIVGASNALPVSLAQPVTVATGTQPLRVTGAVTTERSGAVADRVIVVGWENSSKIDRDGATPARFRQLTDVAGLPVEVRQK